MPDSLEHDALTVAQVGEFGLISRLARLVARTGRDPLQPEASGHLGIGDDAALWEPRQGFHEVLTTDALIENIHFRHATTGWRDLGWKALAENVSDIAAMGALPTRAFITVGVQPTTRVADLEELYYGFGDLCLSLPAGDLEIAGGDTVSSPMTVLSVTVIGEVAGDGLRRAAGRPGDVLAVTGSLGGSAGGLALLEAGDVDPNDADAVTLARLHRRPAPRIAEGLAVTDAGVRCGMDLSDGLLGDAGKLAYASGLSAVIRYDWLPLPPALVSRFGEVHARELALAGGEDFELLVAGRPELIAAAAVLLRERRLVSLTPVGHLEAGPVGQVTVVDKDGAAVPTPRSSWDHFRTTGGRA